MKKLLLALAACVCLAGCMESVAKADTVVTETVVVDVVVPTLPPLQRVEVVPVSPGHSYYWCHGYWHWNNSWAWVPGRYVVRVPGRVWVGPRYFWRGHRAVYRRGYWRR